MVKYEKQEELIADIASKIVGFIKIDDKDFGVGVVFSALKSAEDNTMEESHIVEVLNWADGVRFQACMLHFMLIGAVDVRVIDGEVSFRMANGSPDEMMRVLTREGVAKPVE